MEKGDRICEYKKYVHPSNLLRKLVAFMENQITRNDIERHFELIKSYVQYSQNGVVSFALKIYCSEKVMYLYLIILSQIVSDLYHLMHLLDILSNRISENSIYIDLLEEILKVVSIPPKITKSSDTLTYARDLKEYFSLLGEMNDIL